MASPPTSRGHSWRPGIEVLDRDPSALCQEGEDGAPQLAKDEAYAAAVVQAWREDLSARGSSSVSSPWTYECKSDGASLSGHIYRPRPSADGGPREKDLPGVVLFHTGAGPQDIFLRWKADALASDRAAFGNAGCVVLIADLLGDDRGWTWRDRAKYDRVRTSLLAPDENGERPKLRARVRAALAALAAQPGVDPRRLGALGFCLGGQPILELARMQEPSVKAMATFHGVFDGVAKLSPVENGAGVSRGAVLVCTGDDDPFVPLENLAAAMRTFRGAGYRSEAMTFTGTRHGFTNPAQDVNPSDAFAYSEEAHTKAWSAALNLLKSM